MKAIFCGGGTGGHVYPALTVANALRELISPHASGPEAGGPKPESDSGLQLLYVGVKGRIDAELVEREGIAFEAVTARPLRTGTLSGTAHGALSAASGTAEAYRILSSFRPDVVFATGGYGSVGVGMAARLLGRPLLLFLPDVEAGMAVKALAKVAGRIAVAVGDALGSVPREKAVVSGYPVRPQFFEANRTSARDQLGLHQGLPLLLVSGASTGANAINRAIADMAPDFLRIGQVLHLCGRRDEAWLRVEREKLAPELRDRYHLYTYLHQEMPLALAAADLAVMRAGASTLGELPATRLPAILVPGEYEGWDQSPNARYLEREGAAVMLPQSRLPELKDAVLAMLGDSDRRQRMSDALARLARPDAARDLARLMIEMAGIRQSAPAAPS